MDEEMGARLVSAMAEAAQQIIAKLNEIKRQPSIFQTVIPMLMKEGLAKFDEVKGNQIDIENELGEIKGLVDVLVNTRLKNIREAVSPEEAARRDGYPFHKPGPLAELSKNAYHNFHDLLPMFKRRAAQNLCILCGMNEGAIKYKSGDESFLICLDCNGQAFPHTPETNIENQ